jgi:hypothetical protein
VKNFLFDQYLRAHRNAEELIQQGESKTLMHAMRRKAFLVQNRDSLAQEMVVQKISMRPYAVHQYLLQRCNQALGSPGAEKPM